MRIWDVEPQCLCRHHLLAEHSELHALWNVLTLGKAGYRRHPETLRWEGRLAALYARHQRLVEEMESRGYNHASPLDPALATGDPTQPLRLDSDDEQRRLLAAKHCPCPLPAPHAAPRPETGR